MCTKKIISRNEFVREMNWMIIYFYIWSRLEAAYISAGTSTEGSTCKNPNLMSSTLGHVSLKKYYFVWNGNMGLLSQERSIFEFCYSIVFLEKKVTRFLNLA